MITCSRCNAANAPDTQFCQQCGLQLSSAPTGKPKMKNSLLITLIVVGCIVLSCGLCGTIAMFTPGKTEEKSQTQATPKQVASTPAAAPAPKATVAEPTGVTMANFNKLRTGMTYRQAVAILGAEGEVLSENEIGGTRTVMYQWKGGYLANMNAMFQNDKLISKAQFGLE
jgi:hypothetical protein